MIPGILGGNPGVLVQHTASYTRAELKTAGVVLYLQELRNVLDVNNGVQLIPAASDLHQNVGATGKRAGLFSVLAQNTNRLVDARRSDIRERMQNPLLSTR